MAIHSVENEILKVQEGRKADLEPLIADAESALAEVREATDATRAFLAEEFTFRESF